MVIRSATAASIPDFRCLGASATGRAYRYLVWNGPVPDPLLDPTAWHVRDDLDLRAMMAASDVLLGTHDFRSFCRRRPGTSAEEPIVRRVTRAAWSEERDAEVRSLAEGGLLRFEIEANAFCHQMVRSLVGSLVEVGRGQGNAATLLDRLRLANRHRAPDPAPGPWGSAWSR